MQQFYRKKLSCYFINTEYKLLYVAYIEAVVRI